MSTIELHLDEQTLQRARQVAAARQVTMEDLFVAGLVHLETTLPSEQDPLLGLFSDEPELMDQVIEDILQTREQGSFR